MCAPFRRDVACESEKMKLRVGSEYAKSQVVQCSVHMLVTGAALIAALAPESPEPSNNPGSAVSPSVEQGEVPRGVSQRSSAEEQDASAALAPPEPRFRRRGKFVTVGGGIWQCSAVQCAEFSVGPRASASAGYRWPYVAVRGSFVYEGATFAVPPVDEGGVVIDVGDSKVHRIQAGIGADFHPSVQGRFDPFVGVGLSFISESIRPEAPLLDGYQLRTRSGGVTVTAGIPIFVTRSLSVGPSFNWTSPFAETTCEIVENDSAPDDQTCISRAEDLEGLNDYERRLARRQVTRPWSVMATLRYVF